MVCFRQGGLYDQNLIQILGTESLMSSHVHTCHNSLEKSHASYVTLLGENTLKLLSGFLWTLPHVSFPFADFALYHLTVIKHNYGNDYTLLTVSPSSQSVNLGGGHPKHKYYKCLEKLIKRDHILAHKKL